MFRDRSALLDDLLHSEGRLPGDVKRTVLATAICWRDQKELVSRMSHMRRNFPHFAHLSTEEIVELYRANWQGIMGSPEFVVERLNAYASAGAEEAIILWFGVNDIEGLEAIAEQVLPYFSK